MVTYKKRKNSRPKSGSESSSDADSEAEELKEEKRRQKGKDHADAKKGPPHQKEHTRASDRLQKNQNQPKTESSQPKTESSQPKTSDNKGNKSKQNPKVGKPQLQKDTKNQVFNPALNTKVSVDHHYSLGGIRGIPAIYSLLLLQTVIPQSITAVDALINIDHCHQHQYKIV